MAAASKKTDEAAKRAFNIVRFRVKPGRIKEFIEAHRSVGEAWPGLEHAHLVKVGPRGFCLVAQWRDEQALIDARPKMVETLNSFRDCLEVLSPKLGVTAPIAGPVVLEIK